MPDWCVVRPWRSSICVTFQGASFRAMRGCQHPQMLVLPTGLRGWTTIPRRPICPPDPLSGGKRVRTRGTSCPYGSGTVARRVPSGCCCWWCWSRSAAPPNLLVLDQESGKHRRCLHRRPRHHRGTAGIRHRQRPAGRRQPARQGWRRVDRDRSACLRGGARPGAGQPECGRGATRQRADQPRMGAGGLPGKARRCPGTAGRSQGNALQG